MKQILYRDAFGPILRLLPGLSRYKKHEALIFVMLLIHRICVTAINVMSAALVSRILILREVDQLACWMLISLGLLVLSVGLSWWLDMWFAHVYSYKIIADLRVDLFDAINRISPAGLRHRKTGDVAAAAMSDVEITEWFYAHTVIDFLATHVANLIFTIAMIILVGPSGLILLVVTTLILLVPILTLTLQTKQGDKIRRSLANQKGRCLEMIQGSREIMSLGLANLQLDAIRDSTLEVQRHKRSYLIRSGIEIAVSQLMISAATIGTLAWLLGLMHSGKVNLASIPPAMMLLSASCIAALSISSMLRKLGEVSGATSRYFELIDKPRQVHDHGNTAEFTDGLLSLEFRDVCFQYDQARVINDFSLLIPAGSSVALVGRTGAGKSTLAALVVRLYEPQSGEIYIDGKRIDSIPLKQLRQLVTLVPQHPYIFRGTIRDNLLMAKPSASEDELWQSLKIAQIMDTIRNLPKQLDTVIGERGATLSGGQRQRLSLAQAFLRNSSIVIFDESVSNLDPKLEQELIEASRFIYEGRTTITIAHRLSTIKSADCVAFLHEGKLAAFGPHSELIQHCEPYREFVAPTSALTDYLASSRDSNRYIREEVKNDGCSNQEG
ncbi:ABC transporter ATP-binding protein [Mobiluncus curtisii]|uniref:ABC transporter, ATP-binding protein n=1 Tax=Mobiluncus curtisii ATCC 51333 TaxID=887326 RepID=E6M0S7_9ACTO|nr:ABC transporter ATP-binding protein [Mobiluncus curtisii]EFU79557.1 ABC transporter, ATP-binding protein [Mobiluncus curtisii ATCC 51333]